MPTETVSVRLTQLSFLAQSMSSCLAFFMDRTDMAFPGTVREMESRIGAGTWTKTTEENASFNIDNQQQRPKNHSLTVSTFFYSLTTELGKRKGDGLRFNP